MGMMAHRADTFGSRVDVLMPCRTLWTQWQGLGSNVTCQAGGCTGDVGETWGALLRNGGWMVSTFSTYSVSSCLLLYICYICFISPSFVMQSLRRRPGSSDHRHALLDLSCSGLEPRWTARGCWISSRRCGNWFLVLLMLFIFLLITWCALLFAMSREAVFNRQHVPSFRNSILRPASTLRSQRIKKSRRRGIRPTSTTAKSATVRYIIHRSFYYIR